MALTFADLLSPPSLDTIRAKFLTDLAGLRDSAGNLIGYVSNWAVAGAGRALAEVLARGLGDLNSAASLIAMAGLLDFAAALSDPAWLDALAWGFYDEVRKPATLARVRVTLTSAAGAPSADIAAGPLILSRSDRAMRYRNTQGGTLGPASSLDMEFIAENVGTVGNFDNVSTSVQLVTTLAGISAALHDEGGGNPTVAAAVDVETSLELAARCRLKWATLAYSDPGDKLRSWALEVLGVTKVQVDDSNPRGPGSVDIYLGGERGAVGTDLTDKVQALFTARRLLPSNLLAIDATEDNTTTAATVYVRGRSEDQVTFDLLNPDPTLGPLGLLVQRQALLDIGGTLYRAQLIEDLMTPLGVYNVTLAAPASDVTASLGHILKLVVTLTVVTS